MTETVLEAKDVARVFQISSGFMKPKRPLFAVNGIDLSVSRGEVLALVGESGCGKTTLAKMLMGLMAPSSGTITLDGAPIREIDRLSVARAIQPIFQDPYSSLNPRKTVGAIIRLPLVAQGDKDPGTWDARVTKIMDLVGLPRRVLNAYPNQLSGGQRQRVAIARALINRPRIVICDEPTSALDVSVQSQILNLLQDLRTELGLTYILISHNLAVVEHIATRIAVMYLGRIVEEAPTEALFSTPRHPYTAALLGSVLTPEPGLGVPDTQLGTAFPDPLNLPNGCAFHPRCARAMDRCRSEAPGSASDANGRIECHLHPAV